MAVLESATGNIEIRKIKPVGNRIGVAVDPVEFETDSPVDDETTVSGTGYAMMIVELADDGAAARADLRVGDVLVMVGAKRVESLEDVKDALTLAKGEKVEVVFVNAENSKLERLAVKPDGVRIGVRIEPVVIE
jgi:C-terminal processing protease CtpA/Prc